MPRSARDLHRDGPLERPRAALQGCLHLGAVVRDLEIAVLVLFLDDGLGREGHAGGSRRGRLGRDHELVGRCGRHRDRVGGRRREAAAAYSERVAGPRSVQDQSGKRRDTIGHGRRQWTAQRAAAGLAGQGDGQAAVVSGDDIADVILDRDREAEAVAGGDARRRLGGYDQPGGQLVGGQVGDQEVGNRRAEAGDLIVSGTGARPL